MQHIPPRGEGDPNELQKRTPRKTMCAPYRPRSVPGRRKQPDARSSEAIIPSTTPCCLSASRVIASNAKKKLTSGTPRATETHGFIEYRHEHPTSAINARQPTSNAPRRRGDVIARSTLHTAISPMMAYRPIEAQTYSGLQEAKIEDGRHVRTVSRKTTTANCGWPGSRLLKKVCI
jgi:hypothetical protein